MSRGHALALVTAMTLLLGAQASTATEVISLWPGGGPPGFRNDGPESLDDPARDDQRRDRSIGSVSIPTLTIHRPADRRATGAAVLVLPGGGYRSVVVDKEGHDIARWFNTIGVTAAVLKYRTGSPSGAVISAALADTKRAMRHLRSDASRLGIDPERIGVMGFSAGGDLAIRLAGASDAGDPKAQDPVERASCRPDFAALVYPALPSGTKLAFGGTTAPFFIVHAGDDPKAPLLLSMRLSQELAAAGVPFELHAFQQGDHGFALGLDGGAVRWWPTLLEEWLRDRALLDRKVARVVESKAASQIRWPVQSFWFMGPGTAFAAGVAAMVVMWLLAKGILVLVRRPKRP